LYNDAKWYKLKDVLDNKRDIWLIYKKMSFSVCSININIFFTFEINTNVEFFSTS